MEDNRTHVQPALSASEARFEALRIASSSHLIKETGQEKGHITLLRAAADLANFLVPGAGDVLGDDGKPKPVDATNHQPAPSDPGGNPDNVDPPEMPPVTDPDEEETPKPEGQ